MQYKFSFTDIGEGVAEGEVVRWFVKEGDIIRKDAPLVSVLTDKANRRNPFPQVRKDPAYSHPGKARVQGRRYARYDRGGRRYGSRPAPAPVIAPSAAAALPPAPPATPAPSVAPGASSRYLAAPSVRRLAAERGIDLSTVTGSGRGDGSSKRT